MFKFSELSNKQRYIMGEGIKDWQSGKSLQQCLFHIFKTGLLGDVVFLVGDEGERILAHKCVLASRSCVFERMFCGSLAENGDVPVPDITVPVFRDLMRFLYTDTVSLGASNVFPLLYAANKYSVERLEQKCVEFIKTGLTPENAFTFLQQGDVFDKQDLVNEAKKVIHKNLSKCIQTEGFRNLTMTWLQRFLSCENLGGFYVSEIDLFKAVVEWAKSECKRQEKTNSPADLRYVLKDVLPLIRFPRMRKEDLSFVAESGILTDKELVDLLLHSIDETRSPGRFVSERREPTSTTMYVADISIEKGPTPDETFKETLTITAPLHYVEVTAIKFSFASSRRMTMLLKVSVDGSPVNTFPKAWSVDETRSEYSFYIPHVTLVNKESTSIILSYEMVYETFEPDENGKKQLQRQPWHCNRHKYCKTPRTDGKPQMLTVVHTDPDSGGVIKAGLVCGVEYITSF